MKMSNKYDDVDFIPSCRPDIAAIPNNHKYFLEHNIWGSVAGVHLLAFPSSRVLKCPEWWMCTTRITYTHDFSIIYYLMHSHVHLDRTNNVVVRECWYAMYTSIFGNLFTSEKYLQSTCNNPIAYRSFFISLCMKIFRVMIISTRRLFVLENLHNISRLFEH